jgi:hypothetical protein
VTLASIWRVDKTDNSLRKIDNSQISSPYEECLLLLSTQCTDSCPFCITPISAIEYTETSLSARMVPSEPYRKC